MTKFWVELDKIRLGEDCLAFFFPPSVRPEIKASISVANPEKYKLTYYVEKKRKPRTTGPKSQQAHLHGHLSQIADYTGFYLSEIKEAMKEDLPDWPRKVVLGKTVYMSEADADTVLESKAIEWTHVKAAFLGIILKED